MIIFNGVKVNAVPLHTGLAMLEIAGVGLIVTFTVKLAPIQPADDFGVTV